MFKLKNLPKPIAKALTKDDEFYRALYERPESLSALLPYDEFIEDTKTFRHKDGSLGVVFECELSEHEPMTTDQIIAQVEGLKSWFVLPENCALQIVGVSAQEFLLSHTLSIL